MITNIGLDCINSYKKLSSLNTNKKVNLIYGLNGTGKSTLTNFLYEKDKEKYSSCKLEGLGDDDIILVYNQKFIYDTFYESKNLKGIFTLSKENKEAEQKISNAKSEIIKIEEILSNEIEKKNNKESELQLTMQKAENKIWEIKKQFTGGDRILEFCLEGLRGSKERLFSHIEKLQKPVQKPTKSVDVLKKETESIKGETAKKYNSVPNIQFTGDKIESEPIFLKLIVGNQDSIVAELIQNLNNSDWVKKGLEYLPEGIDNNGLPCPFCQENTITETFVFNIKNYFDESYEKDIGRLKRLLSDYQDAINKIASIEAYEDNLFIIEKKSEFELKYNAVFKALTDNIRNIEGKLKTPSQTVDLIDSSKKIKSFNQFIDSINAEIEQHNKKIDNIEMALTQIKDTFWEIMRWDYDQTLANFKSNTASILKKIKDINYKVSDIEKNINAQKEIIRQQQKRTVNIDAAISNINNGLSDLGINDFFIEKHSETLYKIVREKKSDASFQTLSEGEKMIISFLYFVSYVKGKKSATEVGNKKIIVIDDPISSLSHIYIFNVGRMIKNLFFSSDQFEQVFVLTHSLYFFYELTERKHENRKKMQKLFRMIKNSEGSQIQEMKYSEIQNDYQSYWHIIKDRDQHPALIANCMRNIIEYFFNFVEKKNLNDLFQKSELQNTKYQAFLRYIDRESHSDWQNIFDFKEFDYEIFKEGLGLVFEVNGYGKHYKEMMK